MKNGDLIEVVSTFHDTVSLATFKNVLHFRVTATAGEIDNWATAVGQSMYSAMFKTNIEGYRQGLRRYYPKSLVIDGFRMFNLNTPDEESAYSQHGTGTDNGPAYNPRASVLVRQNTGMRGRNFRGFVHLPPMTETRTGPGGTLDLTQKANFQTCMNNLRIVGSAREQGIWVVYSRKLSTETVLFNSRVINVDVALAYASQRRRRRLTG